MKFEDIKANFRRVEFHKSTQSNTGAAVQMEGFEDGSLAVQIAKQITTSSPTSQATFGWIDKTKNIKCLLSADELREVVTLIRLALSGRAVLFDQNKHNKYDKNPEFSCVNKYHQNKANSKNIIFLVKEFRNEIQLEMVITQKQNGESLTLGFNFSKDEMRKLEMLFYFHQSRELKVPEGILSCVIDESREVLRQDYIPNMQVGDYIVIPIKGEPKAKTFKITKKTYISKYNMIFYSV